MDPLRLLWIRTLALLSAPAALACVVDRLAFPAAPDAPPPIPLAVWAVAAVALATGAVSRLAAPLADALARSPLDPRAAVTAERLPTRVAWSCGVAFALPLVVVGAGAHRGLPDDLQVAAALVRLGFAAAAAVLAGSAAATAVSTVAAEDAARRRWLVELGAALVAALVLVPAGAGYARYRANAEGQYLLGTWGALDRAADSFAAKWPAAASELVSVVTNAPVAIFGANGRHVLARAGGDDGGRMMSTTLAASRREERVEGGWILQRPGDGVVVVSFVSDAPLRAQCAALATWIGALAVAALAAGVLLVRGLAGAILPDEEARGGQAGRADAA